ncbi:MAG: galactosyltransferase-related protein, partial [Asticcacaulis sp.]
LKVDADIVLADDFFDKNQLPENTFIAGNWRNVTSDQNYVNGFFYTFKRALHQVAGFNEHITTYGWDDDDLYERLVLSGFTRKDVVSESVFHLPHSDEERASDANFTGGQTALAELEKGTRYLIRRNRYITHLMPDWGQNSVHVPFQIKTIDGPIASLQRQSYVPSAVPQHIQDTARFHTLLDFTSWEFGQRARELDREKLAKVLERPMADLSRIDIEVALTDISQLIKGRGRYVVLSFTTSTLAQIAHSPALASVIKHLRSNGLTPVFSAPVATFQVSDSSPLKDLIFVPSWLVQNSLPDVRLQAVLKSDTPADTDFIVKITEADLEEWRISRPFFARQQRPKLFIDAQHGLGNRLRAIGSASAIAQATDRELVIVWEPDHHCQCAFSDLFEYSGEVIEKSFVEDARAGKSVVYNYMPNEPEMEKGRLIDDTDTRDIYARSAFTLNSPHSHWESENSFLKQLSPVAPVRNLLNSVRHPNAVSVHVRMETEVGREQNTYDRVENWTKEDHELIHHWRAKSHFSHFLTKIDQLITGGMADTVFLAADLPETYDAFKDKYGHRLAYLPRQLYDRSAQQLHYALADAILLSRAPLLLGSTWSSFSELAMRLAPEPITVKMSGRDF